MYINWLTTFTGCAAGFLYSLTGWGLAAKKDAKVIFEWKKFLPTIILSTLAGGIVGSTGVLPTDTGIQTTVASLSALGIGNLVKKFLNFIWKGK